MEEKDNPDKNTLKEIERQLERSSHFIHSSLELHINRINELEGQLHGLIEMLSENGQLDKSILNSISSKIQAEKIEKSEHLYNRTAIRMDPVEANMDNSPVNCEKRVHICKAVCCKMNFALSVEEIESGKIKWDLGQPYFLRHNSDGYCTHMDLEKMCCSIYEDRPRICRSYSCANDERIWNDFEKMELNHEWIEKNINVNISNIQNISMEPGLSFEK